MIWHDCRRLAAPLPPCTSGRQGSISWSSAGCAVARPCIHQLASFLEHGPTLVGALDLVALDVRECGLCDLALKVGLLGNPIPERATETMRHHFPAALLRVYPQRKPGLLARLIHASDDFGQRHIGGGSSCLSPGNTKSFCRTPKMYS